MKTIKILASCAAIVVMVPLQAQTLSFGGSVLNHDMMWAPDMAQMSRTHVFGTARVMGMGGAFTSLGGDLSSMSINPAGLGLFQRNEISLTPMISVANSSTKGTSSWNGNSKTRFAVSNFGVALNVYESATRSLMSLTLGVGMNRIADFNNRYSFTSLSRYNPNYPDQLMPTIADVFAQQMNTYGVRPSQAGSGGSPNGPISMRDWDPNVWPAILGYDAYMLGNFGTVEEPDWAVERIGRNASVAHSYDVETLGSINEFNFSLGGNINNIIYFGASLGIQSVYKKTNISYQENYGYLDTNGIGQDGAGNNLAEQLDGMRLNQSVKLSGSGVNFKMGVIARPVKGLRLGMAFHTPTYYALDRSYRAGIVSSIRDNATNNTVIASNVSPTMHDVGTNSWDFTSPFRLMFGASYAFNNIALLSVDYQRDWYNSIRVKNTPSPLFMSAQDYNNQFRENFQGTNTVRAGLEVRPIPILSLRVGGGYSSSMLRDRDTYVNSAYAGMPTTYRSYYFSAGAGVRLSQSTSLDVAYQHVTNDQTQYQLFFSQNANTGNMKTWSGLYDTSTTNHYISMTLSYRF